MRRSFLTVLVGAAAMMVVGCSGSDVTTNCGPNTTPVNGQCETLVTCGEGTSLVNNTCQPVAGAGACAEGTQNVEGRCVPAAAACEPGTRFVDTADCTPDDLASCCVPDFEVVCGAGTAEDNGVCVLDGAVSCGPGTVPDTVTSDSGKQDVGVCVPQCTGGLVYDETVDDCVDGCTAGAEFDAVTNTCVALCADDQFYVTTEDTCVDVPECLRNTDEVSGDCVGWPFNELTLETICARRAFNICEPIVDPACACEHAGDYLGGPDSRRLFEEAGGFPRSGFFDNYPAGFAGCVLEEIFTCDQLFMADIRALEAEGQLQADGPGLADFDAYFELAEGTCTRPSDFRSVPFDLVVDITNGLVAEGEACLASSSCAETHQCRLELASVEGVPPFVNGTCLPRAGLGQSCGLDGGTSPRPTPPTGSVQCQEGLICRAPDVGGGTICQQPRQLGQLCTNTLECEEGLLCFPLDLDNIEPPYEFSQLPTCQARQVGGDGCITSGRNLNGSSVTQNVCQENLRCDDAQRGTANDGFGNCTPAVAAGGACSYCDEVQLTLVPEFGTERVDWYTKDSFSVCGGDLACTFEQLEEGFSETCTAAISVCPPTVREVFDLGGVCGEPFEFTCDDELDEDADGDVDCADSDCCLQEICAEDENCIPAL